MLQNNLKCCKESWNIAKNLEILQKILKYCKNLEILQKKIQQVRIARTKKGPDEALLEVIMCFNFMPPLSTIFILVSPAELIDASFLCINLANCEPGVGGTNTIVLYIGVPSFLLHQLYSFLTLAFLATKILFLSL